MNLLGNPFASIEHLKAMSGKGGGIDEERLRYLEELKEMVEMLRGEKGEKMALKGDFDALRRFLEEDLSNRIENLQEGMEKLKETLKPVVW